MPTLLLTKFFLSLNQDSARRDVYFQRDSKYSRNVPSNIANIVDKYFYQSKFRFFNSEILCCCDTEWLRIRGLAKIKPEKLKMNKTRFIFKLIVSIVENEIKFLILDYPGKVSSANTPQLIEF